MNPAADYVTRRERAVGWRRGVDEHGARFAIAIWRIARELAASTATEPDPWSLVRHVARAEHVVELLAAVDASPRG